MDVFCAIKVLHVVHTYVHNCGPTNIFLGSASAIARIGAMITPYIAQVLVDYSLFSAIAVYAVMGKYNNTHDWNILDV